MANGRFPLTPEKTHDAMDDDDSETSESIEDNNEDSSEKTSDDKREDNNEAVHRGPRFYHLLGAPVLLYRNEGSYTEHDIRTIHKELLHRSAVYQSRYLFQRQRAQAKWFYPVDQHLHEFSYSFEDRVEELLQRHTPGLFDHEELLNDVLEILRDLDVYDDSDSLKEAIIHYLGDEGGKLDEIVHELVPLAKKAKAEAKKQTPQGDKSLAELSDLELFSSDNYQNEQSWQIQQNARVRLLAYYADQPPDFKRAKTIVARVNKYEMPYHPSEMRRSTIHMNQYSLRRTRLNRSKKILLDRQLHGDPAYLAVPVLKSLKEATMSTMADRALAKTQTPYDVQDALFQCTGNCIACFPCFCDVCASTSASQQETGSSPDSWWILHPSGPLLDQVRLSHIQLFNVDRMFDTSSTKTKLMLTGTRTFEIGKTDIDIGDHLWQLEKCADNKYVARTSTMCTVIEVAKKPCSDKLLKKGNGKCLGGMLLYLKVLNCIDCRTSELGNYEPRYVAAHPKYGGRWSDPKLAIVASLSSSRGGESNVIKHVSVGLSELRMSHHHIRNLQDIRQVDFTKENAMVLWSAARSYVRPAPLKEPPRAQPKLGHGYSLYSIDLRSSNMATFQWSPSAHLRLVEGVHSISGIATNWSRDNSLFASSISARRTWELDTRMPYNVVNTWSLPHSCDGNSMEKSISGVHGLGFLFDMPPFGLSPSSNQPWPLFGVNCTPNSYGLHLYQQPIARPRFETDSVECANWPGTEDVSVVTSSCFPLPDVGPDVFTCGLFSFRVASEKLHSEIPLRYPDAGSVLCVFTATNKGDVYVHNLLESQSSASPVVTNPELPLGTSAVPVPDDRDTAMSAKSNNSLALTLTNDFPVPSHAILKGPKKRSCVGNRRGYGWPNLENLRDQKDAYVIPIQATGSRLFTMKRDELAEEEENLTIPAEVMDVPEEEMLSTMEPLRPLDATAVGSKSDVTADILSQLRDGWEESDDSSTRSGHRSTAIKVENENDDSTTVERRSTTIKWEDESYE